MVSLPPKYLSVDERYASYRPLGEVTLDEAAALIDGAIGFCRRNDIAGLLLDITGLTGFPSPSTTDRYLFTRQWAETARGRVMVSMVAPAEIIDPEKIGITMAGNRGLKGEVFTSESDAVSWLLGALGR